MVAINLPWGKMKDSSFLITGVSGLIGSFLIDVLMEKNEGDQLNCHVYALGRSEEKMKKRFDYCFDSEYFHYL